MNYDMDAANEYFENEEAKANMRADYREAVPRCRHCGKPIGQITDPWGGKHGWLHNYEDGPDAYTFCKNNSGNEAEPR